MGTGAILTQALIGYRHLFGRLVPLAFAALVLLGLGLLALVAVGVAGAAVAALQAAVGMLWVQGLLVQVVHDELMGCDRGLRSRLARIGRRLNTITVGTLLLAAPGLAATALFAVEPAAGFALLLAWVFALLTVGALVVPVIVIEHSSALAAIRRSWSLVAPRAGTVAATLLIVGVLVNLASLTGERLFERALGPGTGAQLLAFVAVTALTAPLVATALTVLYHVLVPAPEPLSPTLEDGSASSA